VLVMMLARRHRVRVHRVAITIQRHLLPVVVVAAKEVSSTMMMMTTTTGMEAADIMDVVMTTEGTKRN
jgi:hypothetical protein